MSSSIEAARSFLESVGGYSDSPNGAEPSQDRPVKLGIVDLAYSGTGEPMVKFDGESVMGVRTYVTLQPVAAGDRVVMLPVGRTYVVLGSVDGLTLDKLSGVLGRAHGGTGVAAGSLAELKAALGIPFGFAAGKASPAGGSSTIVANVQYINVSVTFPVGRFTLPPVVTLGGAGQTGAVATAGFGADSSVTASGFAARVIQFSSTAIAAGSRLHWTATQMTASSAEG